VRLDLGERSGASGLATQAGETFDDALARVQPAAQALVGNLRRLAETADEIRIEFGIELSAVVGAIIAKTAGQASFKAAFTRNRGGRTP
jgi:hypothetical protein